MADNRKRHYTSAETLAFVQGDMDITRLEENISQAIYPDFFVGLVNLNVFQKLRKGLHICL